MRLNKKQILKEIEQALKDEKNLWGQVDGYKATEIIERYTDGLWDYGEKGMCYKINEKDGKSVWVGFYTGEGCKTSDGRYAKMFIGFWETNGENPDDPWESHDGVFVVGYNEIVPEFEVNMQKEHHTK